MQSASERLDDQAAHFEDPGKPFQLLKRRMPDYLMMLIFGQNRNEFSAPDGVLEIVKIIHVLIDIGVFPGRVDASDDFNDIFITGSSQTA